MDDGGLSLHKYGDSESFASCFVWPRNSKVRNRHMHISMCSTVGRREATSERERAGRSGLFMARVLVWPELQRGQWTVARMMDGSVHRGVLYTVDLESGHMVLLKSVPSEDGKCSQILSRHLCYLQLP